MRIKLYGFARWSVSLTLANAWRFVFVKQRSVIHLLLNNNDTKQYVLYLQFHPIHTVLFHRLLFFYDFKFNTLLRAIYYIYFSQMQINFFHTVMYNIIAALKYIQYVFKLIVDGNE